VVREAGDRPELSDRENEMPARMKSIDELREELREKEGQVTGLRKQRRALAKELDALDRRINALIGKRRRGGKPGPKPGRKPGRAAKKATRRTAKKTAKGEAKKTVRRARERARGKPLVEYIREVLAQAGAPLRVRDIMTAVSKAGYRSASKDFYNIVAATVRDPKSFQRIKRGVYKLKK